MAYRHLKISCISEANLWAVLRDITMFKIIESLADARKVLAVDIHRQICDVYGPIAMSDSKVRNWMRQFKNSWDNTHEEPLSGWTSLITNGLVTAIDMEVHGTEDSR